MRFGFIGLGDLGHAMAAMLPDPLCVYDVSAPAMEPFRNRAVLATSAGDVGRHADLIGLCVRNDQDVCDVISGPDGLIHHAASGTIVAIHSTVMPETVTAQAAIAAQHGIMVFDAAVSGSAQDALDKRQVCMVGGDEATISAALPLLEAFSRQIVHAGSLGQGMVLKFANNLTTYLQLAATVESYALVEAAGIDPALLTRVMTDNENLNRMMKLYQQYRAAHADEDGNSPFWIAQQALAGLAEKDLHHAIEAGARQGLTLRAAEAVRANIRQIITK
ncbi:NAD(P)-dependent oxidoreductase [Sphingosinicella soli]|uniref:3-hydroxyisobutyrate dehydrogenase-like beta-hydroxyacid dehydrogenase n=1 Tax=Sphingosinicella soli TaxID=333708 RepID=A0A7W7F7H9_9SPHN|nr:NAD(P)-dependent oxidoreductase [Sphingosinicella soli]MBB4632674.1 3-hydroxyisobutyrate dehydrogenase-like beta-hydroxyacid dehydrogenase [Sphingosinicella soli]